MARRDRGGAEATRLARRRPHAQSRGIQMGQAGASVRPPAGPVRRQDRADTVSVVQSRRTCLRRWRRCRWSTSGRISTGAAATCCGSGASPTRRVSRSWPALAALFPTELGLPASSLPNGAPPLRGPGSIAYGDQAPFGVLSLAGDDPSRRDRQSLLNTFHTFAQPSARKVPQLPSKRGTYVSYLARRPSWTPEISPRGTCEKQYSDSKKREIHYNQGVDSATTRARAGPSRPMVPTVSRSQDPRSTGPPLRLQSAPAAPRQRNFASLSAPCDVGETEEPAVTASPEVTT